ncbi:MAG: glycerol-3-phosphate 1-O-acyltransferase PlsY [Candidatus Eisenbacteria bacterium]|uniref:Glycerol-3-phosphate acyltransferase n=1 Tax=Eiseniibacteriota bacterium TaxID=2212470 RepID=A0A956M428_UNCEI|nr:glycerol-3-phosphate 1-O-acyltransferase PlsY [Candidatus Eisenbacteria bacterium]
MGWVWAGLLSFLLGSIPSGLWLGRAVRGIDVREHGSGNLGATNVYRTLGPRWGISVLLLDAAKGVGAVLVSRAVGGTANPVLLGLLGMIGAALGHMFTPFAGFRGGKGVATLAGAWGAVAPFTLAIALGVWILAFATTRIVSIASILAAVALPIAAAIDAGVRDPRFATALLVGTLLILRHRSNLTRLRRREERRLDLRGPGPRT